jgi:homoaconitase/3-isopropylmalate dehydratase large subunit
MADADRAGRRVAARATSRCSPAQGPLGSRAALYLASPLTVAASAVAGKIVEYRDGMFGTRLV